MESEVPYKTEEFGELWTVRGPCGNMPFTNEEDADFYRVNINAAYAEGRKSMEKEFKELLDLANQAGNFNQDMMQWKIKFEDWKKAQGIENRIRGGQDGE